MEHEPAKCDEMDYKCGSNFHALEAWQIEVYHRGLKQFTGIERGQYRLEVSQ